MLAEYLAIVRPIEIFFCEQFKLYGLEDLKEFLWADYRKGIWNGEYLSDTLKVTTSSSKDIPAFGYRDYRQVATAFMEKHIKYKDNHIQEQNILDLQAGHRSETASTSYAVSTTDHRAVNRDMLYLYRMASKAWYTLMLEEECRMELTSSTFGNG
jgi:hypothetical protein